MTKIELLHFLEKEAKLHKKNALTSIKRNVWQASLSKRKLRNLEQAVSKKTMQDFIDAVLVDFINYVAVGQGINFG